MLMYTFPVHAAALVKVQFNSLGNSQSATALFQGKPLDNVNQCITQSGGSVAGNVTGSGEFSVDFYSTSNCSGTRTHFSRFSAPDGSSGGTVTCNSDTDCQFNPNSGPTESTKDTSSTITLNISRPFVSTVGSVRVTDTTKNISAGCTRLPNQGVLVPVTLANGSIDDQDTLLIENFPDAFCSAQGFPNPANDYNHGQASGLPPCGNACRVYTTPNEA